MPRGITKFHKSARSWHNELQKFIKFTKKQHKFAFELMMMQAERSIVEGSEITGAPGQAVDTGKLRDSWQRDGSAATGAIFLYTEVVGNKGFHYAPLVEHNVWNRDAPKSGIGGYHSLKITNLNLRLILKAIAPTVASMPYA